jgi:hypothetical protein
VVYAANATIAHNNVDMHTEPMECTQTAVEAGSLAVVEVRMTTTKSLMPTERRLMCNKTADARGPRVRMPPARNQHIRCVNTETSISTDSDMFGAVRDAFQGTRILLSSPGPRNRRNTDAENPMGTRGRLVISTADMRCLVLLITNQ